MLHAPLDVARDHCSAIRQQPAHLCTSSDHKGTCTPSAPGCCLASPRLASPRLASPRRARQAQHNVPCHGDIKGGPCRCWAAHSACTCTLQVPLHLGLQHAWPALPSACKQVAKGVECAGAISGDALSIAADASSRWYARDMAADLSRAMLQDDHAFCTYTVNRSSQDRLQAAAPGVLLRQQANHRQPAAPLRMSRHLTPLPLPAHACMHPATAAALTHPAHLGACSDVASCPLLAAWPQPGIYDLSSLSWGLARIACPAAAACCAPLLLWE